VGQVTAANGTLTGAADANIASTAYSNAALTGSYAPADGNGRVQAALSNSKLTGVAGYPTDYAMYIVDATHAYMMSTDKHSSFVLQAGTAQAQTKPSFDNTALNGAYIGYENSAVNPGLVGQVLQNVLNLSSATVFRGTGNNNGTCTTTNVDNGGLTGLVSSLTSLGSNSQLLNAVLGTYQSLGNSSCQVAANGRAVLAYPNPDTLLSALLGLLGLGNTPPPARVAYLTDVNTGYFLETGYAGLGQIEPQTGASSLATINGSGSLTADGAGHATSTFDENVGVGTLNILNLGVTGSQNYALTDAAAGRYLLGASTVIYAIAPGRYVLIDTNPLNTSPYVSLLY
jgi:large repetitive protein